MVEGRYLLDVEPVERTASFLERLAGIEVDQSWLTEQGLRAKEARDNSQDATPTVGMCPHKCDEHLLRVRSRPLYSALFEGQENGFGLVDLHEVIPLQPHVDFAFALSRVPDGISEDEMLALCLPDGQQEVEAWGGVTVSDGQGSFTVCSPDLNLIVHEVHMDEAPLRVTFTLSKTAVFVVVVEREGRLYLKDGTHRAVGALARGIRQIPCVILRDRGHSPALAQHLPEETLFGAHPPRVTDFLDPALHFSHGWRRGLKVIRVRADEFVIPQEDDRT